MHDHNEELPVPLWIEDLMAKAHLEPEGEQPEADPCRKCGADVEYMASLGEWRRGYCRACEPSRVALELDAARHEIVRMRVERDAGLLADRIHPRRELLEPIRSWLKGGKPAGYWLCLHGPNGTGKTTQLASLLWSLHAREVWSSTRSLEEDWQVGEMGIVERYCRDTRVTYATERQIVDSTMPSAPNRVSLEWWTQRPVLMVDEVGREPNPSDYATRTLWALYDRRYAEKGLTTVLCSNYDPVSDLPARNAIWGDVTLAARLVERLGGGRLQGAVDFTGEKNWRLTEGGW